MKVESLFPDFLKSILFFIGYKVENVLDPNFV